MRVGSEAEGEEDSEEEKGRGWWVLGSVGVVVVVVVVRTRVFDVVGLAFWSSSPLSPLLVLLLPPLPIPDPRLIYNTLRLLSTSLSSLRSIMPLCTSPAAANARPKYQSTLSRHVFATLSFSSSSPSAPLAPSSTGFRPPFAHRRKTPPAPCPWFRRASRSCASCRRAAAAESCWMENCRSRRSDLDSWSMRSRCGLVRCDLDWDWE